MIIFSKVVLELILRIYRCLPLQAKFRPMA